MLKIFKNNNDSNSDPVLRKRLNVDMEYCGLSEEIQKGFLFFLGASMNIGLNRSFVDISHYLNDEEQQQKTFFKIIHMYSESTGDFSDYGDLNDGIFSGHIYSMNYIIHNILSEEAINIDDHLRKIDFSEGMGKDPIIAGKSDLIKNFVDPYEESDFSLNICHNLLEDFFKRIGTHLHNTGFDNRKSYEAGYAFFCMRVNNDIKGTTFLLESIYNFLTPLYLALYSYPILHFSNPKALKSNHIFSSTLQMFYAGIDQHIVQPIHKFHQYIFYENGSSKFLDDWDFSKRNDEFSQYQILFNATHIRETGLYAHRNVFIKYGDFHNSELINSTIDKVDFFNKMFSVVYEKYKIVPVNGEPIWNNTGDIMQYFAILFYETCLHAMVLNKITDEDKFALV